MTIRNLLDSQKFGLLHLADETRSVSGVYAGDLLSWVMGRAEEDQAFVTIMTNINVIAVASLKELSCVIFCEGVQVPEEVLAAAREKEINLLTTDLPMFETCVALGQFLP